MKRMVLAIAAAGIWMNISEFVRNELLIKQIWVDGFAKLGLAYPSEDINGAVWGIWSLIFVTMLAMACQRFDAIRATLILWVSAFPLLWLAMWNMGILPPGLLFWAAPWSLIEVYIAALICQSINPASSPMSP